MVISADAFNDEMRDVVLFAITSQLTEGDPRTIDEGDCVDGSLPKRSLVKPTKLFTIHSTLILKKVCALRAERLEFVLGEIRPFFS